MEYTIDQAMAEARRLHLEGKLGEAGGMYGAVLSRQPDHAEAMHLLGLVYYQAGDAQQALQLMTRSVQIDNTNAFFFKNLGEVYRKLGQLQQALAAVQRAIQLAPTMASTHFSLGQILEQAEQPQQAMAAYHQAIELNRNDAPPKVNLGVLLEREGQYEQAEQLYRQALELAPQYHHAHVALAVLLLRRGELEEGWKQYHWRLGHLQFARARLDREHAIWGGEDPAGKTIVVRCEQSLGDTIQFIRYVPKLMARGADVIVETQPELENLLRSGGEFGTIVPVGGALPVFDAQVALMTLPGIFETRMDSIPADGPYLRADELLVRQWQQRFVDDANLKVGLVWAGDSRAPQDKRRSMALAQLGSLADVAGVSFYSLQVGPAAEQAKNPPEGMKLIDLSGELKDFADTAAALSQLDLLITVDTSVAHLAGAMGRPAWVLTPFVPDWRWLLDREDTPWYSTMRLFRQARLDDWSEAEARVREALVERARAGQV